MRTTLQTLVLTLSTAILILTVNRVVPNADGMLGHDYGYFVPYLLSGLQWAHQNGWLVIPYFTPDYCGGVPWLGNPQSMFYSVPQLLTMFTNPITAVNWTAIIFAIIGAAATYRLMRNCFGASWQASCLGFILFQLNSFSIFRMAVGHLPYHVFGLVPVLSWLVLLPAAAQPQSLEINFVNQVGKIIAAAVLLAVMVYAGATNFVVPAVLSVAALVLVQHIRIGWRFVPWFTLAGACLWALPLSGMKLLPAFMFIHNYPRPYIPDFLFSNPIRFGEVFSASLFAPELLPQAISPIRGSPNSVGVHEFEFSVYIVSLLLITAAIVSLARQPSWPRHLFAWIALLLVVAVPIALTNGNETWGVILTKIPIINNNTIFTRWWVICILPLIVGTGFSFDRICNIRVRSIVLIGCMMIIFVQLALRDLSYYQQNNRLFHLYDPLPAVKAAERISLGVLLPEISQVGPPPTSELRRDATGPNANDGLIWGISTYPCYEPIFGYRHELFPAHQLEVGPVNSAIDKHFNLVDPRCYLSSDSRACVAGSLFRSDQQFDVATFTSHRPLPWQSSSQSYAELGTKLTSTLSALMLLFVAIEGAVRRDRKSV